MSPSPSPNDIHKNPRKQEYVSIANEPTVSNPLIISDSHLCTKLFHLSTVSTPTGPVQIFVMSSCVYDPYNALTQATVFMWYSSAIVQFKLRMKASNSGDTVVLYTKF